MYMSSFKERGTEQKQQQVLKLEAIKRSSLNPSDSDRKKNTFYIWIYSSLFRCESHFLAQVVPPLLETARLEQDKGAISEGLNIFFNVAKLIKT